MIADLATQSHKSLYLGIIFFKPLRNVNLVTHQRVVKQLAVVLEVAGSLPAQDKRLIIVKLSVTFER